MNYRINSEYAPPFRLFPFVGLASSFKLELDLKIRACFPKQITATYVFVKIPMPKKSTSVKADLMKVSFAKFLKLREFKISLQSIKRASII